MVEKIAYESVNSCSDDGSEYCWNMFAINRVEIFVKFHVLIFANFHPFSEGKKNVQQKAVYEMPCERLFSKNSTSASRTFFSNNIFCKKLGNNKRCSLSQWNIHKNIFSLNLTEWLGIMQ